SIGAFSGVDGSLARVAQARHLRSNRYQRLSRDSGGMGMQSEAGNRNLDRRAATRARRAPPACHISESAKEYCRSSRQRALHNYVADDAAARLPGGVSSVLECKRRSAQNLDEHLHAASRRAVIGDPFSMSALLVYR